MNGIINTFSNFIFNTNFFSADVNNNAQSKLLLQVPEVLSEYYINFLSIRDICRLSLVNKKFDIQMNQSHIWKTIFNRQLSSMRLIEKDMPGMTKWMPDKWLIGMVYQTYKEGYSNKLIEIFTEYDYVLNLPHLISETMIKDRGENISNYPDINIFGYSKDGLHPVVFRLDYYYNVIFLIQSFIIDSINKNEKKILGVCCIAGDKIKFSFEKSDLSEEYLNPGVMEQLNRDDQVDWFKRLLQGQKCGKRVLINQILSKAKVKETFDEIYYTLACNQTSSI